MSEYPRSIQFKCRLAGSDHIFRRQIAEESVRTFVSIDLVYFAGPIEVMLVGHWSPALG